MLKAGLHAGTVKRKHLRSLSIEALKTVDLASPKRPSRETSTRSLYHSTRPHTSKILRQPYLSHMNPYAFTWKQRLRDSVNRAHIRVPLSTPYNNILGPTCFWADASDHEAGSRCG